MKHRMRVRIWYWLAVILSLLLVACSTASPAAEIEEPAAETGETAEESEPAAESEPVEEAAPVEGRDTIVIAQGADIESLDPFNQRDTITFSTLDNIYDKLIYRDANGVVQPRLATEWRIIDDLTWEFKLREGVTFHNGEPFNAEAVRFSMDRALNEPQGVHNTMQPIEGVEIIDDYTILIKTKTPYALLLGALDRRPYIVPPQYVTENGWEHLHLNPVGTGPYQFVEWVQDDHLTLVANPDYWGGAPAIENMIVRPIPEELARAAELMTGGVDAVRDLSPDLVETVNNSGVAHVVTAPSAQLMYIALKNGTIFDDVRVRRALALAINRPELVETVMNGLARETPNWINPDDHGFDPDAGTFTYDPEQARALLAEAGYPDGVEFSMSFSPGEYVKVEEVAQAVAGQLAESGFTVTLVPRETGLQREHEANRTVPEDAWLLGGNNPRYDGSIRLQQYLDSANTTSYFPNPPDPELEAQLADCIATVDPDARAVCISDLTKIAFEIVPSVPLYYNVNIWGIANDLQWDGPSDTMALLWGASYEQ